MLNCTVDRFAAFERAQGGLGGFRVPFSVDNAGMPTEAEAAALKPVALSDVAVDADI